MNIWESSLHFYLVLAISPDAPLASWDFWLLESLSSCADVQLSLNALLRQPFALAFPAGTSELHSHQTASGQASSHMLGLDRLPLPVGRGKLAAMKEQGE